MTKYRVIILCAGVGERLQPLTYTTNKSLLDINGKSLIEHWLDGLNECADKVELVHIVIGHYGYKFRKLLNGDYKNLRIMFHENPLFKITGAAQSLYVVKDVLESHPCVVLEGDHYVDPELTGMLMDSAHENCVLVDPDLSKIKFDEEVVAYGHGGTVEHLQWLPPYHSSPVGEALTIFKFSENASNALATILETYLTEDGPAKREIVEPVNRFLRLGNVHYVGTCGKIWTEVDTEEDLEYARSIRFWGE